MSTDEAANGVAAPDVFDEPSRWRLEAARALDLADGDLIAVMSPGPAFPAALRSLESALPAATEVIVDLGAGTGGASEWLRATTGATVYAVEPSAGSREVAATAFPQLQVLEGRVDQAPLPDAIADAVTISGVVSLMSDIGPATAEVDRLLAPNGRLAIADLFSNTNRSWCSGPNIFRSVEDLTRTLRHSGFSASSVGCGEAVPESSWEEVAAVVDEWIDAHCSGRAGYDEWRVDRLHLRHHIEAGSVIGGCVVFGRTAEMATGGFAS